jgi:hypothetical protein
VHDLPSDPDVFLWGANGIWQNTDDDSAQRLRQEEMPFVLATLRAYPRQQLTKSAIAFWQQLAVFGLYDLDASDVVSDEYNNVFPGGRPHYLQSRQAQNTLPLEFFTSVGNWTILVSILMICAGAPFLWRKRSARLVGLSVVIVSTVVANALVTGPLSMVEDRFQSRVIWLLSFLAGLFVMVWLDRRQALCGAGTPAREI